jgi:hypothetical protein
MPPVRSSPAITETALWEWLKTANDGLGRDLHMRRVENLVGVGDPDVQGCLLGDYFDIELKTASRPKRPGTVILNSRNEYVRPAQKVWHRLRWLAGGNNFVLLQVGNGADKRLYLLPGLLIRGIEDCTEVDLAVMSVIDTPLDQPLQIIQRAVTYRSTLG